MELRHLEHFVTVAEERNFTRAARRLHLVQSALSVSIRSLERELGAQLFERTTREVRLTDAGRVLLPEARRTLDAAARAQAAVFGAQEGLRGTLRLGLMQLVRAADVGSLIAQFHRERPLVDIRPMTAPGGSAELISDVRRGTLDAAFVAVSGLGQPGLTATTLASEPVLLGCLPDHPLARRAVVACQRAGRRAVRRLHAGMGHPHGRRPAVRQGRRRAVDPHRGAGHFGPRVAGPRRARAGHPPGVDDRGRRPGGRAVAAHRHLHAWRSSSPPIGRCPRSPRRSPTSS